MKKNIAISFLVAAAVLSAWKVTFSDLCAFTDGRSFLDPGPSYCHNVAQVNYHNTYDCPCRIEASVSASGPFACAFESLIQWGGPFGTSQTSESSPTALVSSYDITLSCGETFKVQMSCSCEERPGHVYWIDQGSCGTECE